MDITIEKAIVIERFKDKQSENDKELRAAIERGLLQSINGEVTPHNEVWDKIRKRYQS